MKDNIIFYYFIKTMAMTLIFLSAHGTLKHITKNGFQPYNVFGIIITMLIFGIVSFALDQMKEDCV